MSKLKSDITKEKVLEALSNIFDGTSGEDVVSAGLISSIVIKGNSVGFAIEIDINKTAQKELLRQQCEGAVKKIAGVERVTAVLTSASPGVLTKESKKEEPEEDSLPTLRGNAIPGVKYIIVVASGKGGVGKSTVSVNLTRALARQGNRVAIVDLDIYGPSIPKMLGISGKPDIDEKNRMIPREKDGIKSISIGYLVEENNAVVWRSSMALKAMNQLLLGVNWGEVDYLIVDTPPGTGDIQLSLCKNFAINGAVLVSTPQDIALADVKKAASLFNKIGTPILGIIENMSYFEDSACKKQYIFGQGGAKKFAQESSIDFLGEIPLKTEIREASDKGESPKDMPSIDAIALKLKKHMEKL